MEINLDVILDGIIIILLAIILYRMMYPATEEVATTAAKRSMGAGMITGAKMYEKICVAPDGTEYDCNEIAFACYEEDEKGNRTPMECKKIPVKPDDVFIPIYADPSVDNDYFIMEDTTLSAAKKPSKVPIKGFTRIIKKRN